MKDAYEAARRLRETDLEVSILTSLGAISRGMGDTHQALHFYMRALSVARDQRDDRLAGMLLNNVGMVHSSLGNYDRALECFLAAIECLQTVNEPGGLATSEANAGWELHHHFRRSDEAITYLRRAMGTLRGNGLSRTANNTTLLQLQMWIDEIEGQPARTQSEIETITRALGEFARAELPATQEILYRNAAALLSPFAEAILEEFILKEDDPALVQRLRPRLALLQRTRAVGIEEAYKDLQGSRDREL